MVTKLMIDYNLNNSSTNSLINKTLPPKYSMSINHFNEMSWSSQKNYPNNINMPNQFYESNFIPNTNIQLNNAFKNSDKMFESNHFFDHLQNWTLYSNAINESNTFCNDLNYNNESKSIASTSAASSASSFMHTSNLNVDLHPPMFGVASTSTIKIDESFDYSNIESYDGNLTAPFPYQKYFLNFNNKEKNWLKKHSINK